MAFVFTSWYFVLIALVAGIVACITIFIKMDKKDRAMIKEFVENNQSQVDNKEIKEQSQNVNSEQNN